MKIALLCSKINKNDEIFNRIDESDITYQGGFLELKKILESKNSEFNTIDKFKNYKEIDVGIIDFSIASTIHDLLKLIKFNPNVKVIYFMHEPETCVALNNKKILNFLGLFDSVLCLRDDLIDNKDFFKILPSQRELTTINSNYKSTKKTGICLINTYYKKPRFQTFFNDLDELYSERIKAINYFKSYPDFHLYGKRWHKHEDQYMIKKIYKGVVENKIKLMSQYKFSICFESQITNGYVSEKIFDSLFSYCVPIYWGAKNIAEYVPKNCFIDYSAFNSLEELHKYLDNLSEIEYQDFQNNIDLYLKSKMYAKNSSQEFAATFLKHIESKTPVKRKNFYLIKLKMIILAIIQPKRVYNKKQRRFLFDTLFYW